MWGVVVIPYGVFDWVEYPHRAVESFAQHSWAHLLGGSLWGRLAFRTSWTFSSLELREPFGSEPTCPCSNVAFVTSSQMILGTGGKLR